MNVSMTQVAATAGLLVSLLLQSAVVAAQVPDIRDFLLNTSRAVYVEVSIRGDGTTELLDAGVTEVPPAASDDDPPLLLIDILDADGLVIGSQNAWDPRYEYLRTENGEEVVLLDEGVGPFFVLLDHRIATLRISDQQLDPVTELAELDVQPVVQRFCVDNPGNDNCVGFEPSDVDADGVIDIDDNCADTQNADQADADGDGAGDLCDVDDDNDTVEDIADNCPLVANTDQLDTDGDTRGDVCDTDDDDDGVLDDADACPGTEAGTEVDATGCPVPLDSDGDGVVDGEDACPATPTGAEVDAAGCPLTQGGRMCDVDLDDDVDKYDLYRLIFSPNRRNLDPGDPRDANQNGRVDFFDLLICIGECDRRYCATR